VAPLNPHRLAPSLSFDRSSLRSGLPVDISFRGAFGPFGLWQPQFSRWTRPLFSRRDGSMRAPITRRHVQTHPPPRG